MKWITNGFLNIKSSKPWSRIQSDSVCDDLTLRLHDRWTSVQKNDFLRLDHASKVIQVDEQYKRKETFGHRFFSTVHTTGSLKKKHLWNWTGRVILAGLMT